MEWKCLRQLTNKRVSLGECYAALFPQIHAELFHFRTSPLVIMAGLGCVLDVRLLYCLISASLGGLSHIPK